MASWLWAYGKRFTLWGALLSSLTILFFPLMFFSVLGIAFSVPLGCSFAIYVCLRKFCSSLFKEEVKGLGVKESEARGVSGLRESEYQEEKSCIQEITIHEDNVKPLGEEETEEVKGYGDEQPHEGLILTQALKYEEEAPLIENSVSIEEAPEETQALVREKWAQHEESPEDEAHKKDDEREAQLKEPHEGADNLQWAAQNEQFYSIEEPASEVETNKDETGETSKDETGEAQVKENGDTNEEEGETLQAERGEEGEAQLKNPLGEDSPVDKIATEKQAPEDEAHYRVMDEEESSEGEAQLKLDTQEEGSDRLGGLQEEENTRQDQAVDVEAQSSPKKKVEVEVKVNPSKGEAQSDHSNGSTGENIGTKDKRIEEQDENNEQLCATDTKHKIREEADKEHDESNGVQEIPHKRSRHEQSLDLAPSTLYTENTSTEANRETPEATRHSGQQSIQAESPLGASNLGGENGRPIEDNEAAALPIPPSSEILVSSESESDKDSTSLSEGAAVKEDSEDAKRIWEEIHALRNIIGYKEDPHLLYAEEIKALYVFTGVEPPTSLKYSGDLDKAKEKLELLKLVYGIN